MDQALLPLVLAGLIVGTLIRILYWLVLGDEMLYFQNNPDIVKKIFAYMVGGFILIEVGVKIYNILNKFN